MTRKHIFFFYSDNCPKCPPAHKLVDMIEKKINIAVFRFNTNEPVGLAEASFNSVMSTPTIIIFNGAKEIKRYTGDMPEYEEIIKVLF